MLQLFWGAQELKDKGSLIAVPFKYAQKEVKGIVYILSFGIGVAIVSLQEPMSVTLTHSKPCRSDNACS